MLAGIGMGFASDTFGKGGKVNVPTYAPIDLTKSQASTIAGNQANAPAAQTLAGQTTTFNTQQILKMLETATGGAYSGITSQVGKNILSGLKGELPPDVVDQIRRYSASVGQGRGYLPGSGGGANFALRNLGISSLETTYKAMDSATKWLALQDATFAPAFYSSANMFMSPAQRATIDVAQNQFSWQTELAKEQVKAMPDPRDAAFSKTLSDVGGMMTGAGLMSSFGGGGGGGLLGNRGGTNSGWTIV